MKYILIILLFMTSQIVSTVISTQKPLNIIFEGEYTTDRGPCNVLPDGSRRWILTNGFKVTKVIEGDVKIKYIEVNLYDSKKDSEMELTAGKSYKVSLHLYEAQLNEIVDSKTIYYHDNAIILSEIIEIKSLE